MLKILTSDSIQSLNSYLDNFSPKMVFWSSHDIPVKQQENIESILEFVKSFPEDEIVFINYSLFTIPILWLLIKQGKVNPSLISYFDITASEEDGDKVYRVKELSKDNEGLLEEEDSLSLFMKKLENDFNEILTKEFRAFLERS